MVIAIDISKWNGKVDFAGVKSNKPKVDLVIIKATQGSSFTDPKFVTNASGAIMNGIAWGAYHFANLKFTDPSKSAFEQAGHFIKTVNAIGKPSVMVLDVETNDTKLQITGKQLESFCSIFLSILEQEGLDTAIYMSPGFSWFLPKGHKLGKYKMWIADYTGAINPVNGWDKFWLHQYTDKGSCAGVKGFCDLNNFK